MTLTPEKEALNLHRYGTKPCALSPQNIYQAAVRDIENKAINADIKRQRDTLKRQGFHKMARDDVGPLRRFAFLPAHVRATNSPEELLALALKEIRLGKKSSRLSTLRIYDDTHTLKLALEIAKQ